MRAHVLGESRARGVWCAWMAMAMAMAWGGLGVRASCDGFRVVVVVVGRRAREARGGEDLAAGAKRIVTVYACVRLVCASCVVSCVVGMWCACRVVVWCGKGRTTD